MISQNIKSDLPSTGRANLGNDAQSFLQHFYRLSTEVRSLDPRGGMTTRRPRLRHPPDRPCAKLLPIGWIVEEEDDGTAMMSALIWKLP